VLQKFLFVGVGGSGGKTLRVLRHELGIRLREVGYGGPIPKAWQFLHVDVPVKPDGNEPRLPEQLPAGSYVPLAAPGLSYRDIDGMLMHKGATVLEHTAGWRPDPTGVFVDPVFGAGQYRAVGRIVAAASMEPVGRALARACSTLSQIDVEAELREVSRHFKEQSGDAAPHPTIVVVSSIAGGSGAGAFLDICDALRFLGDTWQDKSVAILYTPDVFQELASSHRAGVQANALATLCELLAGYWNNRPPVSEEFATLEAAGMAPTPIERRGPRYPLIVGRSNSRVSFSTQIDVYRAVGRSLAAWVTSAQVQQAFQAAIVGNWTQNATALPDRTQLAPGMEQPLGSFGYASVGLGRDRFASYAADRLAGAAVEKLLRGHRTRDLEEETDEAALERSTTDHLWQFQGACGLRELGQDHNQILDALRGGPKETARTPRLREAKAQIARETMQNRREGLTPQKAAEVIDGRLRERQVEFTETERAADQANAREWVVTVQQKVIAATAELLGRAGAPVASRVLDETISELKHAVVPELKRDAENHRHFLGTLPQRIHSVFANFNAGAITADNPLVQDAVKQGTDSYWHEAEANLHLLAADLAVDLADNLLAPLREAVERGRSRLEGDATSTPDRPSTVDRWLRARDFVPADLEPAQNEGLLEPTAGYRTTYERLLQATCDAPDLQSAEARAVGEVIGGTTTHKDGRQTAVKVEAAWSPRANVLPSGGNQRASFQVGIGANELHGRSDGWLRRNDTAVGDHLRSTLEAFLRDRDIDPQLHAQRLNVFRDAFSQALDTSMPFAQVDPVALLRIHEKRQVEFTTVTTLIPFPQDHPARAVVRELLQRRGMEESKIDALFGDGDQAQIELMTFLASPYNAMAFSSLTGPIANDLTQRRAQADAGGFWRWRRARPLPQFVPVPPDTRMAMIRGWFTARALGQVDVEDFKHQPVRIWTPEGMRAFPFPVLGPPLHTLDETLPALLESLPLAMLQAATLDEGALDAYRRIARLGLDETGPTSDYTELRPELVAWTSDGAVVSQAPEAPPPAADGDAATRVDRLKALARFFENYMTHYERLEQLPLTAESALRVGRAWELRRDVVRALRQLQDACKWALDAQGDPQVG
jgi:hypothetical protein